ncbi:MAG: hypothetical protein AVDCRST_MAG68-3688 [uncultured Gemmatimonadetes bacterium]|uniref:Cohesin domain-containing protein n=1 Tax=uncultured Gemmatimonadota bacterium TaxID=203437 RepID=A0A6J4M695_9BACT|nr:MAG: hypothetical protein AVDCRST_MAG68-3688 [uncultured Gemmatimonadota bacterium]
MSITSFWHKTPRLRAARLLLAASVLALGACTDKGDSVAGIPRGAADGLYPQIVVSGAASTADLKLSLLRKPAGVMLGSYQGELSYDPAVLTLEQSSLPAGVEGVVNDEVAGKVRFVASAVEGVGEVPLLSIRFARRGAVDSKSFAVSFEEVSAAEDFTDLTPLVYGGAPAVSVTSR